MQKHAFATFTHDGARSVPLRRADALEEHLEPAELAKIWKLDATTIRRIFQDMPGVLKLGKSNRRDGKRDYVTLRIPRSLAEQVYRERTR